MLCAPFVQGRTPVRYCSGRSGQGAHLAGGGGSVVPMQGATLISCFSPSAPHSTPPSPPPSHQARLRAERAATRTAFEAAVHSVLEPKLKQLLSDFDKHLDTEFSTLIGPQLKAGADTASAEGWGGGGGGVERREVGGQVPQW